MKHPSLAHCEHVYSAICGHLSLQFYGDSYLAICGGFFLQFADSTFCGILPLQILNKHVLSVCARPRHIPYELYSQATISYDSRAMLTTQKSCRMTSIIKASELDVCFSYSRKLVLCNT